MHSWSPNMALPSYCLIRTSKHFLSACLYLSMVLYRCVVVVCFSSRSCSTFCTLFSLIALVITNCPCFTIYRFSASSPSLNRYWFRSTVMTLRHCCSFVRILLVHPDSYLSLFMISISSFYCFFKMRSCIVVKCFLLMTMKWQSVLQIAVYLEWTWWCSLDS